MSSESTSLPFESKYWPSKRYSDVYSRSLEDMENFWDEEARKLEWFRCWDKVLDGEPPFSRWFVGGQLNASYQCVDFHDKTWRRNKVALYWEGEPGDSNTLSYSDLYRETNKFASVLRNLGIRKGDRVALYLPMIPELPIFMLACARLGAPHTVIFSGFSARALADRVKETEAKVLITSNGAFRRGKVLRLKDTVDEALTESPSVESVIVVKRTDLEVNCKEGRDYWLKDLLKDAEPYVKPEPVESTHPIYILYTSGTTGKPKGIVHSTGGYIVYNHSVFKWVFDIREDTVYWCTADVGWVTGHSNIVYAPLSHGATLVVYEGAPDYPSIDRWWQIIDKFRVTAFYTSPTAIRMFMRYGEEGPKRHDLSSLKILGTVGEPINPEAWIWYYKNIGRSRCPIVDTWWQTETGGIMISPLPGLDMVPLKPGSVTFPLPGIDAEVVKDNGEPTSPGERGYLIIRRPWPGMLITIYKDPERYKQTYWSRFPGMYFTSDYAIKDQEGYFWILGRADEVLKIAGHRLGAAELESAAVAHPGIAEAAVIGKPDPIKGEIITIFAIPRQNYEPSEKFVEELKEHIRKVIGPIATPEEIYFVTSLPKTRSGKIMRRVLKAVATGSSIGDLSTLEDEASVEEVKRAYEELKKMAKS
ncbi:MAG: acetate--CoA ligase [Candidatus Methylarchaceae archaeon HK01B]|nr:acetate--CoA ligase [Candidatus Methylarchaceae archaeon HK01B]